MRGRDGQHSTSDVRGMLVASRLLCKLSERPVRTEALARVRGSGPLLQRIARPPPGACLLSAWRGVRAQAAAAAAKAAADVGPAEDMAVDAAPTLDTLFRKTTAKPAIYWLPLTEEEVRTPCTAPTAPHCSVSSVAHLPPAPPTPHCSVSTVPHPPPALPAPPTPRHTTPHPPHHTRPLRCTKFTAPHFSTAPPAPAQLCPSSVARAGCSMAAADARAHVATPMVPLERCAAACVSWCHARSGSRCHLGRQLRTEPDRATWPPCLRALRPRGLSLPTWWPCSTRCASAP